MPCKTFSLTTVNPPHLENLLKLRYEIFVAGQNYDVPTYDSMEYDQFDTPAASYILHYNKDGEADGCVRLLPTTSRYMLLNLWPDIIKQPFPCSNKIYEISRFGAVGPHRKQVFRDMLGTLDLHSRAREVSHYIFVANRRLVKALLGPSVELECMGPEVILGRHPVQACRVRVSDELRTLLLA